MILALVVLLAQSAAPPPLVRTPVQSEWAYGHWRTYDGGDFTVASTRNEAGSVHGAICGNDCVWFVNFQTECKHGDRYPGLVNSKAGGSYSVQLTCYHMNIEKELNYLLTFPMGDGSLDNLSNAGELGFAFPLQSGKFGVSRFSLSGAASSIRKAMEVVIERRRSNQEGLRDFTI